MMAFLVKHKLINPSQHGFLKARSCLTNLLCFFEEITKWVDEGSPVDIHANPEWTTPVRIVNKIHKNP